MQDKLDKARELVLDQIIEWASVKRIDAAPAHLRNLAAVYDILTEKKLAENRLQGPICDANGDTFFIDSLGRRVAVSDVT